VLDADPLSVLVAVAVVAADEVVVLSPWETTVNSSDWARMSLVETSFRLNMYPELWYRGVRYDVLDRLVRVLSRAKRQGWHPCSLAAWEGSKKKGLKNK
jgi:hypothetical protein